MAARLATSGETWRWIAIAGVLLAWFVLRRWLGRRRTPAGERDPDLDVLAQLGEQGVDLTQPHRLEFFLYFRSRAGAVAAAAELPAAGFAVEEAGERSQDGVWLVLATKTMAPEPAELRAVRRRLDGVARRHRGEYDGWGTPVP